MARIKAPAKRIILALEQIADKYALRMSLGYSMLQTPVNEFRLEVTPQTSRGNLRFMAVALEFGYNRWTADGPEMAVIMATPELLKLAREEFVS